MEHSVKAYWGYGGKRLYLCRAGSNSCAFSDYIRRTAYLLSFMGMALTMAGLILSEWLNVRKLLIKATEN